MSIPGIQEKSSTAHHELSHRALSLITHHEQWGGTLERSAASFDTKPRPASFPHATPCLNPFLESLDKLFQTGHRTGVQDRAEILGPSGHLAAPGSGPDPPPPRQGRRNLPGNTGR